jgi:predicted NBD/HSP70 family sugar kinase
MSEITLEPGYCIGLGGTNARTAACDSGDILKFSVESTPARPPEFFAWMARQLLVSAHNGSNWMVAGFPGPVSPDGQHIGPMANVQGMKEKTYSLQAELVAADSDVQNAFDQGFKLVAVNDGSLAAHAAASRIGEYKYDKAAALIIGTGVGAGVVIRDPSNSSRNVYHADRSPLEIGHIPMSDDPFDRFEDAYCGPGIERRYGMPASALPEEHPAWIREGKAIAKMSLLLGLMNGVELVVPTGGVGVGASEKYGPYALGQMHDYWKHGNGPQKKFAPEVLLVPPDMCQEFEMYGAEGAMLDHLTRPG